MSSWLEPAIWSRDTDQRIPCFDRCQLIVTWMSNINDVPMVTVLLLFFKVWDLANGRMYGRTYVQTITWQPKFWRSMGYITKFSKVWGSARASSTRRSSVITHGPTRSENDRHPIENRSSSQSTAFCVLCCSQSASTRQGKLLHSYPQFPRSTEWGRP